MRIEQLTFTRFIAAVSIVVFHFGQKSFIFNNEYVGFIFKQANVGVSYFFVLSGFVMVIAYESKTTICFTEYIKNRFARIYPVYLFAIVLVLLPQFLTNNVDFEGLILNLLMIQAWFPGQALSFNPLGWSLSVELLFYVLFPFLFNFLYKKERFKNITIGILLFWFISQVVFHFLVSMNYIVFSYKGNDLRYFPLMHLNEFLIGNLAGFCYVNEIKKKKRKLDWQIGIVAVAIGVLLKFPIGLNFHNGILALLFVPLILLISLNDGRLTSLFNNKLCVFLGEISFGIYILQYPVFSIISAYSVNKYFQIDDFTVVFFIRLILLILLSSLSYVFIETPIRNKIRKK